MKVKFENMYLLSKDGKIYETKQRKTYNTIVEYLSTDKASRIRAEKIGSALAMLERNFFFTLEKWF
jgi:hypothetical protein